MRDELNLRLASLLGPARWLTSPAQIASYCVDWTGRWHSEPIGVARPLSVGETQTIIRIARECDVAVVIQGGNTGLVGGAVGDKTPHLLLSTRNLRERLDVDEVERRILVSAGHTLAEVQQAAGRHGLEYPVDLASRDSATIGGTVATAAGGLRVVAHGDTAAQVVDVTYVDEAGDVRHGLEAVGVEGTNGVIVEVELRLVVPRLPEWTALIACETLEEAIAVASTVGEGALAAELMAGWQANAVARLSGLPSLPVVPWWLLIEGDAGEGHLPDSALLAMDQRDSRRFWAYRELHTEAIARETSVTKLDAAVPVDRVEEFVASVLARWPRAWLFGHLMVGNLHLAVSGCDDVEQTEAELVGLMLAAGGALAGEHGIGQAKSRFRLHGLGERAGSGRLFNPQIAVSGSK